MFEKSLYDLIRGLRNHKGTEKEYIQESLRECRKEIRGPDMDLKATALLKLIYLEMFGHDMSWASFHVLEVMSSQKYFQKRVGYLGAVQSFRPDTEVLMLAENLLKKDLSSPIPTTIALPLVAVPHVVNPPMASSLLSDLLPRLSHSNAAIRKKTVVTLYRLALVYPETLRPAWPKIKERLLDDSEDQSVTAAIVNVVCELGWRRPQDFLSLAPRLFDLLVEGGNNWMAIKIIKLFATLTPLEPRLVKKLVPPLTSIIKSTPAMSLLYECINGIIQGGILDGSQGMIEGEEIARLCVGKLRGMLVVEGDPNLKYVALLAFSNIVKSHPHLVSLHQDVILECIDDPDVSIRSRTLDLVVDMVNSDNLQTIVARLMRQLRLGPIASSADAPYNDRAMHYGVIPAADSDDEDAAETLRPAEKRPNEPAPLPDEYRVNVIKKILEMCSRDTYANVNDFEWYIDILVQLVRHSPAFAAGESVNAAAGVSENEASDRGSDISYSIGSQLQNVAIRVKGVRTEATRAAEILVSEAGKNSTFPTGGRGSAGALDASAWIVGEYADHLLEPDATLTSLVHPSAAQLPARVLCFYVQAIPKVLTRLISNESISWTPERKTVVALILARVLHFLEPLTTHSSLEVQERAVEFVELTRLAADAASSHEAGSSNGGFVDPPLLLTQALPSLFLGIELNPVAPGAQTKVPVPADVDLGSPINGELYTVLQLGNVEEHHEGAHDEFYRFYNTKSDNPVAAQPAANRLDAPITNSVGSYQQNTEEEYLDPHVVARRKADRNERYRDDPFYIMPERRSGTSTPIHNILKTSNWEELDIDSIPIMSLNLENQSGDRIAEVGREGQGARRQAKPRRNFAITPDETIASADPRVSETHQAEAARPKQTKVRGNLLQVDSSGLGSIPLEIEGGEQLDVERREREEAEMAQAMKEVERLRLEMQRASERIQPKDVPVEGTLVKPKKKNKAKAVETTDADMITEREVETVVTTGTIKKKKKKINETNDVVRTPDGEVQVGKPKKRKKRKVTFDGEQGAAENEDVRLPPY